MLGAWSQPSQLDEPYEFQHNNAEDDDDDSGGSEVWWCSFVGRVERMILVVTMVMVVRQRAGQVGSTGGETYSNIYYLTNLHYSYLRWQWQLQGPRS